MQVRHSTVFDIYLFSSFALGPTSGPLAKQALDPLTARALRDGDIGLLRHGLGLGAERERSNGVVGLASQSIFPGVLGGAVVFLRFEQSVQSMIVVCCQNSRME